MSQHTKNSLFVQRENLRQRLAVQRQIIAQQLHPEADSNDYPRSKVMRFLRQRSALAAKLLAGFVSLLAGVRLIKPPGAVLTLAKMVQSISKTKHKKQQPASGRQSPVSTVRTIQ